MSNSIAGNYLISHYDYEEFNNNEKLSDNNNLQNIYNYINLFVNKSWTLKKYELASFIQWEICSKSNQKD